MQELSGGRKRLTVSNCTLEDAGKIRYTHGKECQTWARLFVKKDTPKNRKAVEEEKRRQAKRVEKDKELLKKLLAQRARAQKAGTLS